MAYSSKSRLSLLPHHPQPYFLPPQEALPVSSFYPVALTCFWLGLFREPWILNSDPFSSPGSVSMLRVGQGLSTVPHGAGTDHQAHLTLELHPAGVQNRGWRTGATLSSPLPLATPHRLAPAPHCQIGASNAWPPHSRSRKTLD